MSEDNYQVVVNEIGQYSVWPTTKDCPLGWSVTGFAGTKPECLDHIGQTWQQLNGFPLASESAQ
jgi:MbtH protein